MFHSVKLFYYINIKLIYFYFAKEKAQEVLDQLNNEWDGEVDDCIAYGFNTKMFDSLVYHLNFQLYD